MTYDQERRRRCLKYAKHEAGHALILLVLGIPFKNVEIMPVTVSKDTPNLGFVIHDGDMVAGLCRMDAAAWFNSGSQMTLQDRIVQAMAGNAGEQIDWAQPRFSKADWTDGGLSDKQDVERKIRFVYPRYTKKKITDILKVGFSHAWNVLQDNYDAHAALTAALMEKSLVTYAECLAIWEAHRG